MNRAAIMVAALGGLLLSPQVALPCSFLTNEPHTIDPNAGLLDTDPPKPPKKLEVESLKRGVGPDITGATTSCDDIGTVAITMDPAEDRRTTPEEMGYRVLLVAGTLPDGLRLPIGPVRQLPLAEGDRKRAKLLFVWLDGASDDQEPLDFTVDIIAVDRAGLESGPARVRVRHPGSNGCATAAPPGSAGGLALALSLLGLTLWRRRRRRRRSPPTPASWWASPRGC